MIINDSTAFHSYTQLAINETVHIVDSCAHIINYTFSMFSLSSQALQYLIRVFYNGCLLCCAAAWIKYKIAVSGAMLQTAYITT